MNRLLINPDKCNGCRECEIACAAKQTGTLKLLKRQKDGNPACADASAGRLWHPLISLTKKPIPSALISVERSKVKDLRFGEVSSFLLISQSEIRNLANGQAGPKSYVPFLCLHCDDAPCIDTCISGAMRRDKKTGLVFVDREQCVGCWSCIMVCPFGVIQRRLKSEASSTQKQVPSSTTKEFALKCDGCPDLQTPACVTFCEPKALVFMAPEEFSKTARRQVAKQRVNI